MEYGLMVATLVRLYEALTNLQKEGEKAVVGKIVFVMFLGGVVGYFGIQGVTVEDGIVGGLATSGVFTGIAYIFRKLRSLDQ